MSAKLIPREAQEYRVDRILNEPTKASLLGDVMGLGKSLVAIEAALRGGFSRVLVVTGVKDTYSQFEERFAAQSDNRVQLRRIDSTKPGKQAFADFLAGGDGIFFSGSQFLATQDWTLVPQFGDDGEPIMVVDKKTGQATDKQLKKRKHLRIYSKMRPLDLLIVDEVHIMAANRKANGRRTLASIPTDRKLAMSGTWYGGKFENAWSITRWLWPEIITPNFYAWRDEWCTTETVYAKGGKKATKVTGEINPGQFVLTLPCYIRGEAEEKAPAPKVVYVDLDPEQREQYDALERDLLVWLKANEAIAPLVADLPITLRSRLRSATLGTMSFDDAGEVVFAPDCRSSKLTALRSVLDFWGKQPVVIYTDSKKFANVVGARMNAAGYKTAVWSGDVPSKGRDAIKAAFLAGEVQYIVAVIQAFGTGLDGFQRVANKICWLSESDSVILNEQATARLFRPGRTLEHGGFEMVKLVARDTLDAGVFSSLVRQVFAMNASLRKDKDKNKELVGAF